MVDRLSFAYPDENGAVPFVVDGFTPDEREYLAVALASFTEGDDDDGLLYAFALYRGCLLVRVYDRGDYYFVYPIVCREGGDAFSSVLAVCDYAKREELPLVFTDVPSEELGALVSLFRHCDVDAESPDASAFRVSVKTECMLLGEAPSLTGDGLSLSPLCATDEADYARLCGDPETNEYWGYDYRAEHVAVPQSFFLEDQRRAFVGGTALSLALRGAKEELMGEVLFYYFDGRGAAELALRLLPEYRGRGIARGALPLAFAYAKKIGLVRLFATVDERNAPSLALFGSAMRGCERDEGRVHFSVELYR